MSEERNYIDQLIDEANIEMAFKWTWIEWLDINYKEDEN